METNCADSEALLQQQEWLSKDPRILIERWRLEIVAGLRDAEGHLTCAGLDNPNAPPQEALRISAVLMTPEIQAWLKTPIKNLIKQWRAQSLSPRPPMPIN